jgi:hypothetical protein
VEQRDNCRHLLGGSDVSTIGPAEALPRLK